MRVSMSARACVGALFAGAACIASSSAFAQGNYHPYPVGERALGFGGAYTALADDAAGGWYNPAGIAFARDDSVSVSSNLYGVVGARFPNSFGNKLDYDYQNINLVPSTTASLIGLGDQRRDGSRPVAIAINLYNPNQYQIDRAIQLQGGATTLFVSTNDRMIAGGPTVAWRVSDRVGIGISILATLHTYFDRVDLSDVRNGGFVQFTQSVDSVAIGLGVAGGVRVDLGHNLSLGLSARTPSVAVWGEGHRFERTVRLEAGGVISATANVMSVQAQRLLPGQFRAGVAWVLRERFAISFDTILSMGLQYASLGGPGGRGIGETLLKPVCNAAAGVEWFLRPTIALHGGLFSDLSAAPTPLYRGSQIDQVDSIGAVLAGTLFVRGTSTTLGAIGTYGRSRVVGTDVASGTYSSFVSDGTQWKLYFVWAGTTRL